MTRIISALGGSNTVSGASGQRIYAFNNISTSPQQVVGANPARQSIIFHNPGPNDILVAPAFVQTSGSDQPLVPTTVFLGGCFRVYGNGGTLQLTGEVAKPWQAFAISGTTNPLTVMESNI